MGWLGEELADQSGRGIGPRTTKDLVEGVLQKHMGGVTQ